MFKKALIITGILLALSSTSFAEPTSEEFTVQAKCAQSKEFLELLKQDHEVPLASLDHKDLGALLLSVSPTNGNWFILYFKGNNIVCSVLGGDNFKINAPNEPQEK